ncbi:LuxR C-terminal-related transcriptional regulator [Streptomyces sp. NPDC050418]|uniref:LuxR C-terminal-related transcriptional regulator n=1 Tax=Streptomyces sp. NPDC050418 TaxID=3365612 RepID=UPI0037AC9ED3
MSVLGISTLEEALYRHFLRNPGTAADEMHLLFHASAESAAEAVGRLCELRLLRASQGADGQVLSPTDPATAVDQLIDLRLRELHQQLQAVTQARHLTTSLCAEQGLDALPPQGVERMENIAQIRNRLDDLAFFAREEVLSVDPYTALTADSIAHTRPLDLRCLRRGLRIRNVVIKEALNDPPTLAYLREIAAHGAEIRVTDDVAERIIVFDRSTALVPLDPSDTSRGALMARETGLVAGILALFEKIWAQSVPLADLTEPTDASRDDLSETERQVLQTMCRVEKDEVGARELQISVRTYRRHIADLLRILSAASRAQAALLARERGWI